MKRTLSTLAGASVLAAGLMALAPSQAQAAAPQPQLCTNGYNTTTGGFSLSYNGAAPNYCRGTDNLSNASDAGELNFVNNNPAVDNSGGIPLFGTNLTTPGASTPTPYPYSPLPYWTFDSKTNSPALTPPSSGQPDILDISFTNQGGKGTFTIGNTNYRGGLALLLKQSQYTSVYYWDNIQGGFSGNWNIGGIVNQGNSISHWGAYTTAPVPEPITLLGSGIALGFGMYAKRKLNGQKAKI
jgi:hypothetical protein